MIITVKVKYTDGTTDIKECHSLEEIPLDELNRIVESIKIIREEDEVNHSNANCDHYITCPKNPNRSDNK